MVSNPFCQGLETKLCRLSHSTTLLESPLPLTPGQHYVFIFFFFEKDILLCQRTVCLCLSPFQFPVATHSSAGFRSLWSGEWGKGKHSWFALWLLLLACWGLC